MHIILLVVFLLIVVLYFGFNSRQQSGFISIDAKPEAQKDISEQVAPVFISDGKLFSFGSNQKTNQIESPYVEDMSARFERNKKLAGWKEGTTWDTSFAQMRGMGERHEESNIEFSSVTRFGEKKLLYFLKGAGFGGLFEYCMATGDELRIMHRQNLHYQDLSRPNDRSQVLLSAVEEGGGANIAVTQPKENVFQELTGGDTLDTAPSWVSNRPDQIVYQSQGLARDPKGYIKGVGPAEIILFDIKSGDMNTIFADDNMDYLKPGVSSNGSLYFISRPYDGEGAGQSNYLQDALFFPFRLLRAVFHYLNFFSLMYSRKPLTSAGGPKMDRDIKDVVLQGRRIDAEKALRKRFAVNGVPSLVPSDWLLVRCDEHGNREVLATHVASYSLGEDDNVIYSNGCGIFYITPDGKHKKVTQENVIDQILL